MTIKVFQKEEKVNGHIIRIVNDENPLNPRTDYDNVTTMVCFHKRYDLGDKNHGFNSNDYKSWSELRAAILKRYKNAPIIMPLYMYDHSGLCINTSGFHCPWDSGQIGWIFITRKSVLDTWGKNFWKKDFETISQTLNTTLQNELDSYQKYLNGEAYGYEIYSILSDEDGKEFEEFEDSCYGYETIEDALDAAKANL
jgi:hypothetical protein